MRFHQCTLLLLAARTVLAGIWVIPYEAIYAFKAYEAEVIVTQGRPTTMLPSCRGSGLFGCCDLNEFLSHVSDRPPPRATLDANHNIIDLDTTANSIRAPNQASKWQMEPDLLFPNQYDQTSRTNRPKHADLFGHMADILDDARQTLGNGVLDEHMRGVETTLDRAAEARFMERATAYQKYFKKALAKEGITYTPKVHAARGPFPQYDDLDFSDIRRQLSATDQTKFDTLIKDWNLKQNGKFINRDLASHNNNINDVNLFRQRAIFGPCAK